MNIRTLYVYMCNIHPVLRTAETNGRLPRYQEQSVRFAQWEPLQFVPQVRRFFHSSSVQMKSDGFHLQNGASRNQPAEAREKEEDAENKVCAWHSTNNFPSRSQLCGKARITSPIWQT